VGLVDELAELDGVGQAELVRRAEITAEELVAAAIARIERLNPQLNAVVTPLFEQGLAATRALPKEGPFAGVPFLVKDLIATCAGVRHTEGSAFLRDHVAERDSELVARFRRAGLVILGKTNTAEFGNASTTEPRLFGPTRNPWDRDRTPGGSSGGSAAAVAAGMVPMAHGNDGGGSLRIPASCCGLFALKPTRGRNPLGPEYGDLYSGLVAEHVLTRSVRDSAAALDATAGPDAGDPHVAPPSARPFSEEVGADPGRLQIAFSVAAPNGAAVAAECADAVLETARLCAELGHEVSEAAPTADARALEDAWFELWADGNAWLADRWGRHVGRQPRAEDFEPLTWELQQLGRRRSAAEHLRSVEQLQAGARSIGAFFESYDLWLTPTLAQPPVPIGALDPPAEDPLGWVGLDAGFAPFTATANATGQPAMSLPLHWSADGLPIGSHFTGRFGHEATLLRLAAQLEEARPWRDRRPRISVSPL
jgi:amidase